MEAILCDIEGTTTSISFAHDVLFPDSYEQMDDFIHSNWDSGLIENELASLKLQISEATGKTEIGPQDVIATLKSWIESDKKETSLKSIQGKIWKRSFESGKIKGHAYPDVLISFQKWKARGLRIAIFSSGSVEAQQLIFRYSEAGDLTKFIDAYFDTTSGPKKEAASYAAIADSLGLKPTEILFLSDVTAELDAAKAAGMETTQLLRDNMPAPATSTHKTATSFLEIVI